MKAVLCHAFNEPSPRPDDFLVMSALGHSGQTAEPQKFKESSKRELRVGPQCANSPGTIGKVILCPLWVKSRHVRRNKACQLYPQ
jgi:hypothetical protein